MLGAFASVVRVFAPGLAVNGVPTGYTQGPLTAQIIMNFMLSEEVRLFCGVNVINVRIEED